MIFVSGILEIKSFAFSEVRGVILGLGAALLYGTVVLMNKYIKGVDPLDKTIIQLVFAALTMLIYIIITKEYVGIEFNTTTIILISIVGIVHTGISYLLYFSSFVFHWLKLSNLISNSDNFLYNPNKSVG